ncbi:hypothetical protein SETIT_7G259000v2 [Setaria italica]|uniref:Uncharacterized protein n=1 Tax=Setaria italica TaxID=4555 RepID=A0A368RZV0_SETIT|nr:hypothetical protein SETIT_7G259000v2 [Setaria italica]
MEIFKVSQRPIAFVANPTLIATNQTTGFSEFQPAAVSSRAGCFTRYGLISTGAPPRHGNTLALGIPTTFLASKTKSRRLAVVVADAGAVPGGSDDGPASPDREPDAVSSPAGCFTCYGLISTGAPPRHGNTLALGIPTTFLASKTKNRRLAVVVAAAGAMLGGSDDGPVSPDREFQRTNQTTGFSEFQPAAVSSPAGCFTHYDLISTGAPPRHGNTLALGIPTTFLASKTKSHRLAVVVAAAGAVPGGSDDGPVSPDRKVQLSVLRSSLKLLTKQLGALIFRPVSAFGLEMEIFKPAAVSSPAGCFTRYGLISIGAPPRHGNTLALGIPTTFLASKTKSRRLVMVVAAAGAVPRGSNDGPASPDREFENTNQTTGCSDFQATVLAFRLEMEIFKVSQRPIAFVANPTLTSPLLDEAFSTAKKCTPMVEFMLAKEDVHPDVVKELGVAGQAFLVLEEQAREGYMRADALVNCIQGIKLVRRTFFKDGNISEYPDPMVPLSADIVDKMEFFVGLIVYANANLKYGGFGAI